MKWVLRNLLVLSFAALPVSFAYPAHADCAMHCPVPGYTDLEQMTCYVLDKDGSLTPNGRLTTATAMSLKFDLDMDTSKTVVDNAIRDYCPWDK